MHSTEVYRGFIWWGNIRFPRDPLVAGLGSGPLALSFRDPRSNRLEPRSVVPHARGKVGVDVDRELALEVLDPPLLLLNDALLPPILLAEPFVLLLKLAELLLRDDDLIVVILGNKMKDCDPRLRGNGPWHKPDRI